MACIRKRRGKYVVDYRDALGVRRWATCETKREADSVLAKKVQERHQGVRPDTRTTVAEYAERWLKILGASVKPATVERYEDLLAHILPTFGAAKVSRVRRAHIKAFLAEKMRSGLSRDSVRLIHATLRAMFNAAVEDELRPDNPAARLGKQLRLVLPPRARQEEVKAFTQDQLSSFLDTASAVEPSHATLFLTLARTGLRLGESLALQWDDLDLSRRELRVARSLSHDRSIDTPKSGHGRTVDLSG
jgi:integrase